MFTPATIRIWVIYNQIWNRFRFKTLFVCQLTVTDIKQILVFFG